MIPIPPWRWSGFPCPMEQLMKDENDISPVIVAPTFNNAGTLPDILGRIARLKLPIIIVNDGSTDATRGILGNMASFESESAEISTPIKPKIINHERNLGKAAAMASGFAAARSAGFTHAITIDTDGQHHPEQITELLWAAKQNPQLIVLGRRDKRKPGYPILSRFGRRF